MGIPTGVFQVQRWEQDLNAPQFVNLSFSLSRQCNQRHKNNFLCKQHIFVILWQTRQIKSHFNNKDKTITEPKLFTKVVVLVALITLARRTDGNLYHLDDGKQPKTFGSNIFNFNHFFNLLALYIE